MIDSNVRRSYQDRLGAIVGARAGEGLEHIGRVFRYLKEIVPLTC